MPANPFKIKDLKDFIKKERLYLWLVLFMLLINLMVLVSDLTKEGGPEEPPKKVSKTKALIEQKDKIESAITEDRKMSIIATAVFISIALLIFAGLLLDFLIFIRKTDKKELLERCHSPPEVTWSMWDALKVVILFLFFGYVIALIEGLFSPFFPSLKANERIVLIINTTILDLIGVTMVFYFAIRCYKHRLEDLGLTLKNFFKNVSYGVFGYISIVPILAAALLITVFFIGLFKYEPTPQPVLEMFLAEEKKPVLMYLSLFVAIGGPIVEEIFFRGFLYSAIKKGIGIKGAIFISALLFSFLHAHLVGFLPILILGMFLAYLYEKTGSLTSSITVHIIHNLLMVIFIFLIKGIKF